MRAVVKVKPMGGKGDSRVARYIAESKLDPVREGKRRPLFSDREDDLAGADNQRYEQLKDYAERTREELYRGFEEIDGLLQEIEKSRAEELMDDNLIPDVFGNGDLGEQSLRQMEVADFGQNDQRRRVRDYDHDGNLSMNLRSCSRSSSARPSETEPSRYNSKANSFATSRDAEAGE